MPFDRPTLDELITRVSADLRSRLQVTGSVLRRAVVRVLGTVWGGAVHMLHGHLEWLSLQAFADTAEREYLRRIASLYGFTPTAATFAVFVGEVTGVDDSIIPEGVIIVRSDGTRYRNEIESTVVAGVGFVVGQALESGSASSSAVDDAMTLESPIAGVSSVVTVTSAFDGNDEEDTEAFRARFVAFLQEPPTGGSEPDYLQWTLAVAGVTRAWVYEHEDGLGTVTVRFVRDNDVSIFPDAGEVSAVQDALDEQRPVTAQVTAAAPTALAQAFTIAVEPDTTAVRAAVTAELDDLFLALGEPGDGAGRGTIKLSRIRTAIGVAEGLEDYTLTIPAADVVPALGQLPTRGTITFV